MSVNRRKGTYAETRVRDYFRANGFPFADRQPNRGTKDQGDISGVPGVCIEVKNCRQWRLAEWVDEMKRETKEAGAQVGVVVVPRSNHGVERAYAIVELATFVELVK